MKKRIYDFNWKRQRQLQGVTQPVVSPAVLMLSLAVSNRDAVDSDVRTAPPGAADGDAALQSVVFFWVYVWSLVQYAEQLLSASPFGPLFQIGLRV